MFTGPCEPHPHLYDLLHHLWVNVPTTFTAAIQQQLCCLRCQLLLLLLLVLLLIELLLIGLQHKRASTTRSKKAPCQHVSTALNVITLHRHICDSPL